MSFFVVRYFTDKDNKSLSKNPLQFLFLSADISEVLPFTQSSLSENIYLGFPLSTLLSENGFFKSLLVVA